MFLTDSHRRVLYKIPHDNICSLPVEQANFMKETLGTNRPQQLLVVAKVQGTQVWHSEEHSSPHWALVSL